MSRRSAVEGLRYVVATYPHLEGARLSKAGHWGNIPYPDEERALAAAAQDAGGRPFTVEPLRVRRKRA